MEVERLDAQSHRLCGVVDLANLMEWKQVLEESLPAGSAIRVSLSGLEYEGSAILAMMVFLTRRSRSAGGSITFEEASERLFQMTEMADLTEVLSLK